MRVVFSLDTTAQIDSRSYVVSGYAFQIRQAPAQSATADEQMPTGDYVQAVVDVAGNHWCVARLSDASLDEALAHW